MNTYAIVGPNNIVQTTVAADTAMDVEMIFPSASVILLLDGVMCEQGFTYDPVDKTFFKVEVIDEAALEAPTPEEVTLEAPTPEEIRLEAPTPEEI